MKPNQVTGLSFFGLFLVAEVLSVIFTLLSNGDSPINVWCALAAFVTGFGGLAAGIAAIITYFDLD